MEEEEEEEKYATVKYVGSSHAHGQQIHLLCSSIRKSRAPIPPHE